MEARGARRWSTPTRASVNPGCDAQTLGSAGPELGAGPLAWLGGTLLLSAVSKRRRRLHLLPSLSWTQVWAQHSDNPIFVGKAIIV
jgi:hypothetical protein